MEIKENTNVSKNLSHSSAPRVYYMKTSPNNYELQNYRVGDVWIDVKHYVIYYLSDKWEVLERFNEKDVRLLPHFNSS